MFKILSTLCLIAVTSCAQQVGNLVTIRNGEIYPSNTVAHISALASTAAEVQAALATANATQAAALILSNELAVLRDMETERNAIGYINGFVESFSAGIEADTNMTASIIYFESAGTEEGVGSLWDIYTYFSTDPGVWPVVTTSDSAGRTNAWDIATQDSVELTTKIVGSTEYECYKNRVITPLDQSNAFFRVRADISGVGTNLTFFPVTGGISVNGHAGITVSVTEGTNTMQWIGGVRIQ